VVEEMDDDNEATRARQENDLAASTLISRCAYASAAVTLLPLPGTEVLAVTPIHVGMILGIGHIYGHDLSRESAAEIVVRISSTAGLSLVTSRVATTIAKTLLPGVGGLLGAPILFASTHAVAAVARALFSLDRPLSDEEMREVYSKAAAEARRDFDPRQVRTADAQQMAREAVAHPEEMDTTPDLSDEPAVRLRRLDALREQGLLSDEEYHDARRRILAAL
jgi:uncharacterized protein (DUF697 family)